MIERPGPAVGFSAVSLKGWETGTFVASECNVGKRSRQAWRLNGGFVGMRGKVREVWLGERSRKNSSLPNSWQMDPGTSNDSGDTHVTTQNRA